MAVITPEIKDLWFVVSIRPFLDATKRYGLT